MMKTPRSRAGNRTRPADADRRPQHAHRPTGGPPAASPLIRERPFLRPPSLCVRDSVRGSAAARAAAMKLSLSWALPLLWLPNALCVDHSKFRTCQQTNFCVRKRTAEPGRAYLVGPQSVSLTSNVLSAELHGGPWGVPLTLQLFAYDTGVARMRITETRPLHGPRWEPDDILLDQVSAMRLPCTCDALAMH